MTRSSTPMADLRKYAADELGRDGYPPAWHESIKHVVREASGHRCVRCGHPYEKGAGEWSRCDEHCAHGTPVRVTHDEGATWATITQCEPDDGLVAALLRLGRVEARWRILTVHHLDGDKTNCRWWNLAALCQRCHLRIQRRVQMERVWPWEHSDWFKPYVAGYYAWTFLGEELDRAATESRLNELLALERLA